MYICLYNILYQGWWVKASEFQSEQCLNSTRWEDTHNVLHCMQHSSVHCMQYSTLHAVHYIVCSTVHYIACSTVHYIAYSTVHYIAYSTVHYIACSTVHYIVCSSVCVLISIRGIQCDQPSQLPEVCGVIVCWSYHIVLIISCVDTVHWWIHAQELKVFVTTYNCGKEDFGEDATPWLGTPGHYDIYAIGTATYAYTYGHISCIRAMLVSDSIWIQLPKFVVDFEAVYPYHTLDHRLGATC